MAISEALDTRQPIAEVTEEDLRVQLAAAYRLVEHFGWTTGIYGHLTVRVPGPDPHFLINPFGLRYEEVTASNLVKIDCDGNTIGRSDYPVNNAGFVIHSAIHMAEGDNACVMHTHTRAGVAVSATKEGLQMICQGAAAFYGRVSYHDYEGIALRLDERDRLVVDLGDNRQMILRNHGLLTTGRTVSEAFLRLWMLQSCCETQVDVGLAGTLNVLSDDVAEVAYGDFNLDDPLRDDVGQLEFSAWMRMLDKIDPSYRT